MPSEVPSSAQTTGTRVPGHQHAGELLLLGSTLHRDSVARQSTHSSPASFGAKRVRAFEPHAVGTPSVVLVDRLARGLGLDSLDREPRSCGVGDLADVGQVLSSAQLSCMERRGSSSSGVCVTYTLRSRLLPGLPSKLPMVRAIVVGGVVGFT